MGTVNTRVLVDVINRVKGTGAMRSQTKQITNLTRRVGAMSQEFTKMGKQGQVVTRVNSKMVDGVARFGGATERVRNKMTDLRSQFEFQHNTTMKKAMKDHNSFGKVMGMNALRWRDFNQAQGKFTSRGARAANRIRNMTHGLRRFKMELLGVMFFGMGVQKFFAGLLRPALEISGVMELFSTMMQILFLPVALQILDWVIWLTEKVGGLSDWWKKFIGWVVILGTVLGGALFLIGMFGLGIGSLILAFGTLFNSVTNFLKLLIPGEFGEMGAALFLLIPGLQSMSFLFEGLGKVWNWLKGIWADVSEKLGIDMDAIKDKIRLLIKDVKQRLKDNGIDIDKWIGDLTAAFGSDGLKGLWEDVMKFYDDKMKPMWKSFSESIDKLITNLPSLTTQISLLAGALGLMVKPIEAIAWWWRLMLGAGGVLGEKTAEMIVQASELTDNPIGNVPSIGSPVNLGPKQSGGFIPHTGLYGLHQGETVVPANQSVTASPTINIFTSGGVDNATIDRIKIELGDMIASDLARSMARR